MGPVTKHATKTDSRIPDVDGLLKQIGDGSAGKAARTFIGQMRRKGKSMEEISQALGVRVSRWRNIVEVHQRKAQGESVASIAKELPVGATMAQKYGHMAPEDAFRLQTYAQAKNVRLDDIEGVDRSRILGSYFALGVQHNPLKLKRTFRHEEGAQKLARSLEQATKSKSKIREYTVKGKKRFEVECQSVELMRDIAEATGEKTRLPWEYLATDEERRAFLSGYLDAKVPDAPLRLKGVRPAIQLGSSIPDEGLQRDIQALFATQGIYSTLNKAKDGFRIDVNGELDIRRIMDLKLVSSMSFRDDAAFHQQAMPRGSGTFDLEEYDWVKAHIRKNKIREPGKKAGQITKALNRHLLEEKTRDLHPDLTATRLEETVHEAIHADPEILKRGYAQIHTWVRSNNPMKPFRVKLRDRLERAMKKRPDPRAHAMLYRGLGFDRETSVRDASMEKNKPWEWYVDRSIEKYPTVMGWLAKQSIPAVKIGKILTEIGRSKGPNPVNEAHSLMREVLILSNGGDAAKSLLQEHVRRRAEKPPKNGLPLEKLYYWARAQTLAHSIGDRESEATIQSILDKHFFPGSATEKQFDAVKEKFQDIAKTILQTKPGQP